MKDRRRIILLIFILVLATILRIYRLKEVPIELFGDELDVGYHAYSLLKTGRDYTGHLLPSYISSLAEARAPLFIYSVVPFIGFFGLSEWGVRLPAVFFGILSIVLAYLLTRGLFRSEPLALIASFLLAILPWHIHYSRAAYEVTLLVTLFLGGVLFFLKGLEKPLFLLFSACLFALTPYTYSTANLFLPLLFFSFLLIYKEEILKLNKKWLVISFLVGFVILLPFIGDLASGQAADRFSKISLFADQKLIDNIIFKRSQEEGGGRLFHNKLVAWSLTFFGNYLTSFSPQFLFLHGDPNLRHGVWEMGGLYLALLPLLLIGILVGVKNIGKQPYQLLFSWLLLSPIPAAFTQEGGTQATRLFLMLPPLVILSSSGLLQICKLRKKRLKIISLFSVFCLLFAGMIFYLHQYFVHWPKESWRFWHYGYKEAMLAVAEEENEYDQIVFNNTHEPILLRFLFWTKRDPSWFQENFAGDKETEEVFPEFLGFKVSDRYLFGRITGEKKMESLFNLLDDSILYLAFQEDEVPGDWNWQENPPEGVKVIDLIKEPFEGKPYIYLLSGR